MGFFLALYTHEKVILLSLERTIKSFEMFSFYIFYVFLNCLWSSIKVELNAKSFRTPSSVCSDSASLWKIMTDRLLYFMPD